MKTARAVTKHFRTILLCALCISSIAAAAQRPTRYVQSDSVILWDMNDVTTVIPSLIYATDGRGIYVCQYVNSYARIHFGETQSFSIDQLVSVHEGLKYRITDVSTKESTVSLYIHKPAQPFTLYLNGHETDFPIHNNYICILRSWYPQDEVWIDLHDETTATP